MTAIDHRLLDAGLGVTVATLAAIFADHHRGIPAAMTCPGCGHPFAEDDPGDCPTNTLVRPLLARRRREDPHAVGRLLTPDQYDDLRSPHPAPARRPRRPRPPVQPALFPLTGGLS